MYVDVKDKKYISENRSLATSIGKILVLNFWRRKNKETNEKLEEKETGNYYLKVYALFIDFIEWRLNTFSSTLLEGK